MSITHNLGFPRIGAARELKFALEAFWNGASDEATLRCVGRELRQRHWQTQHAAGIDLLPVGDFAWYDQVLNHCVWFGALPPRFGFDNNTLTLPQYFELARGRHDQFAMEMTKWFDTNYHYLVPEWQPDTHFSLNSRWLLDEVREAQALGHAVKPVLIGPLTLLHLGKCKQPFDVLQLLPRLVPEYLQLLRELAELGVEWVQIDEPILTLDLDEDWKSALWSTCRRLALAPVKLLLASYFGDVSEHARALCSLPVAGLHLDLVRAAGQLPTFLQQWPADKVLSLGLVDGRSIWRTDLDAAVQQLQLARAQLGEHLWLAPSCSLLHCPLDLGNEQVLDDEIRSWLAFGVQKLEEISLLREAVEHGTAAMTAPWAQQRAALASRRHSPRVHNPAVARRLAELAPDADQRTSPWPVRNRMQQGELKLPLFPTTTIGSFPQTAAIRASRAAFRRGQLSQTRYSELMHDEIRDVISRQLDLGLDVLVHGEAERNDMVEYFGEQLDGFAFTEQGWVQSYGSRCVKPPIIYGDVRRPAAMTTAWSVFAQSLTEKPVKGMLTGPITLLQWSFVRDDQPRRITALQLALAVNDEVLDLEQAGIRIIQIDEPALREGLPLRRHLWHEYLAWAGRAFRLSAAGVQDQTQIHTHMCYAEFNDILPAIAALDADVITIETSRSDMELLRGFQQFNYPNAIGPGVYDIHSPRLPGVEEMCRLLDKACQVIAPERLWVNPDCGLKTRGWSETMGALRAMVESAAILRQKYPQSTAIAAARETVYP